MSRRYGSAAHKRPLPLSPAAVHPLRLPACRAHSKNSMMMRCAGLAPVAVPGVENVNLSSLIDGHTQYLDKMEDVLSAVNLAET